MTSLNPVLTVQDQIAEVLKLHRPDLKGKKLEDEIGRLLEVVGIPAFRMTDYPHQFSGSMKQRVVIAIAIACSPELLIADEPTTALDVTIQAQVLNMMRKLRNELNSSMLMITHWSLLTIIGLSIWSGMCGKKTHGGGGSAMVAGSIIGTLVGGNATVGTAQLAYYYGMSAWWFTLGAGITCAVLAIFYVKPLRRSACQTMAEIISKEFGAPCGMFASVLASVGTVISTVSQIVSATAVIAVVFPSVSLVPAVAISTAFMAIYVVFGGVRGAGMVGLAKTVLLYVAVIGCGVMVLAKSGGLGGFVSLVNAADNPEQVHFFSLLARGAGKDIGAFLSLLFGVVTTQSYMQGFLNADTDRAAQGGALISALVIPPIGACGVLVGLYMRANAAAYPGLVSKAALTTFVTSHLPPLLAGIVLGGLFITVVGSGAGLALGVSTMINRDIVRRVTNRFDDEHSSTVLSRVWIVLVLAVAGLLSCGSIGDVILRFAFMSMGLRGAVVFLPLMCALFLPGRVDRRYTLASIIISPILVLLFGILDILPFDALFVGMLASFIIMSLGLLSGWRKGCFVKKERTAND